MDYKQSIASQSSYSKYCLGLHSLLFLKRQTDSCRPFHERKATHLTPSWTLCRLYLNFALQPSQESSWQYLGQLGLVPRSRFDAAYSFHSKSACFRKHLPAAPLHTWQKPCDWRLHRACYWQLGTFHRRELGHTSGIFHRFRTLSPSLWLGSCISAALDSTQSATRWPAF